VGTLQQFGFGTCSQRPPTQALSVQTSASSPHVDASLHCWQLAIGVATQPVWTLQESVVHGFESLQTFGVWSHAWSALHVSTVHALPSSHCAFVVQQPAVAVWTHAPVPAVHESTVHRSPSSQSGMLTGCWQTPWASHLRTPLQRSPSSQLVFAGKGWFPHDPAVHTG